MPGDGTRPRLLTAQPGPPDEEATLDLAHADESNEAASSVGHLDDAHSLSDETVLRLAEWVYLNVEEVWSGFNLLAEAVARGFEANAGSAGGRGPRGAIRPRVRGKATGWHGWHRPARCAANLYTTGGG